MCVCVFSFYFEKSMACDLDKYILLLVHCFGLFQFGIHAEAGAAQIFVSHYVSNFIFGVV